MSKKISNGKYAYGVEKLRAMMRLLDNCNESFNQEFSIEELVKLHSAYQNCEYDIPPHRWSERQIADALKGKAPQFDDSEQPVYPKRGRPAKAKEEPSAT